MKREVETVVTGEGVYALVFLTKGKIAIVDLEDAAWAGQWNWSTDPDGYAWRTAKRGGQQKRITLHREVACRMGLPIDGSLVDHVSGDVFDCRRCNLRIASKPQNGWNSKNRPNNRSGYKGVSLCPSTSRWQAHIHADGEHHFLGRYDTAEQAGEAYAKAALRLHGEFGRVA